MNINRIDQIYQVYKSASTKRLEKTEKTSGAKDAVNISNEAKDFQTAFNAAIKADDVREDVVNDIKEKIDNGEYKMNTDDLVNKIVNKK